MSLITQLLPLFRGASAIYMALRMRVVILPHSFVLLPFSPVSNLMPWMMLGRVLARAFP